MNIKLITMLSSKLSEQITALMHGHLKTLPAYFNEASLEKYINTDNAEARFWIFLCRVQRFILLSASMTPLCETQLQEKEQTQSLLFETLGKFDALPLSVIQLMEDNAQLRQGILYCLFMLKPEKTMLHVLETSLVLTQHFEPKWLKNCLQQVQDPNIQAHSPIARFAVAEATLSLNLHMKQMEVLINEALTIRNDLDVCYQQFLLLLSKMAELNKSIHTLNHNMATITPSNSFCQQLLTYLSIHLTNLIKDPLYRAIPTRNMISKWTFQYFLNQRCATPEEYVLIASLHINTLSNLDDIQMLHQSRLEIMKVLLIQDQLSTAYELFDDILTRRYFDLLRSPKEDLNLLALLLYLSKIANFISDGASGSLEFNPIQQNILQQSRFTQINADIKGSVQEYVLQCLKQLASLFKESEQLAQSDRILDIYHKLLPLLKREQQNIIKKSFDPQRHIKRSAVHFFASHERSSAAEVSAIDTSIPLPDPLLQLRIQFNQFPSQQWFLTGAAVLELYQQQCPNDYDIMVIGPSRDQFESQLKKLGIAFKKQGKLYPVFILQTNSGNLSLEIDCQANSNPKNTMALLKDNFLSRDFKPCALMLEIPDNLTVSSIISFNKALKQCHRKLTDTCRLPLSCFKEDPLRLLRLIKWDLKHKEFSYHPRLSDCLSQLASQWLPLCQSKRINDGISLFKGRLRTSLTQLMKRFQFTDLLSHPQFQCFMACLFQINVEQVVFAAEPIVDHVSQFGPERSLFYFLFSLYLAHYQHKQSFDAPIRSLCYFSSLENDWFLFFEAAIRNVAPNCHIFDSLYQQMIEHHGLHQLQNMNAGLTSS